MGATLSPDAGCDFTVYFMEAFLTVSPWTKGLAVGALNQTIMLRLAGPYWFWIRLTLKEQITVPEVSGTGDCPAFGCTPVVRLEVQAVGATGFQ
jgi:hypothetical protein